MLKSTKKFIDVATEYGPIRGCTKESALGRRYYNFQKIPYMKPPVGNLRFRDPQAPDPWTDPLDCTEQGPAFCHFDFLAGQFEGELDAMFINIYTNNISPKSPYPVMVWIHPGGIFTGHANSDVYGPDYLMQKDVVLVTFQYRIGAFGFLSLDDPTLNVPGNAQFRDHIFALKWIQRNIAKFGGDPNNVTLFGESWGGGSTSYHMISDKSKGLFHRGILMSGTALHATYSLLPRRQWALKLCKELGYEGPEDDKCLLEFLESADPKEIVLSSPKILTESEENEESFFAPFGPTIEPYDNGNIFLSDEIVKMARNCWGNEIDIMIGGTSNELSGLELKAQIESELKIMANLACNVPMELGLAIEDERRKRFGEMIRRNYYGVMQPSKTNIDGVLHANNDVVIWHPISRIVRSRQASKKGGKSFVYRFDYDSENNLLKKKIKVNERYREPTHGDDVFYIFKTSKLGPSPSIDSSGFTGIKLMISLVTQFAKDGNPNILEGVEWEPATFDKPLNGVNINEKKCEYMELPEAERIKVFDEIFNEMNKNLY